MSTILTIEDFEYMTKVLDEAREDTSTEIVYKGLIFKQYGCFPHHTWRVKTKLSDDWTVINCSPVDYIVRMNNYLI